MFSPVPYIPCMAVDIPTYIYTSKPMILVHYIVGRRSPSFNRKEFYKMLSSVSAIASPTSLVFEVPPMSPVRIPFSMTILTASSTFCASSGRHREYLSIMLTDRTVATGLAIP